MDKVLPDGTQPPFLTQAHLLKHEELLDNDLNIGNEEKVKKAQELIQNAVIGLIIVFLSYTVTNFVITNLLATTK